MHSPQSIVIVMNTFCSYVHISFFCTYTLSCILYYNLIFALSPKKFMECTCIHDELGNPDGVTQTILYVIHIAMIAIMHKRAQLQISKTSLYLQQLALEAVYST